MKKFNFFCSFLMLFVLGELIVSCSKDKENDINSSATLIGTWLWMESSWEEPGETPDYPYFIVQENYCYFCKTNSVNNWGERYKYMYDESNKTITAWQIYRDDTMEDTPYIWSVLKLTQNELWIIINEDELVKFKRY